MKLIYILFFISSISCYSQVVSENKVDEFTGYKYINVDASEKNKFSFSNNISDNPQVTAFISSIYFDDLNTKMIFISFSIMFNSTLCLNDGKAYFLLDDESKLIFTQVSKIECGKSISAKYIISPDYDKQLETLKILSTKKIEKIRILTNEGALDFKVKDNKKEIVKNHFGLMETEILKIKE